MNGSRLRLGVVQVTTPDIARLAAFYEATLGLRLATTEQSADLPGIGRIAVLCAGCDPVLIACEQDHPIADRIPVATDDHFVFEVEERADLDGIVERLVAVGASDGAVVPYGPTWRARFVDPDGRSPGLACFKTDRDQPDAAERTAGLASDESTTDGDDGSSIPAVARGALGPPSDRSGTGRAGGRMALPGAASLVAAGFGFGSLSAAASPLSCFGPVDPSDPHLIQQSGFVVGTPGDDIIITGAGDDVVTGGGGDDRICVGAGDDRVSGGDGNDRIDGGPGRDLVRYETSPSPVVVDLMTGLATGHGTDHVMGFEMVVGSSYDDLISGDEASNTLSGFDGDDRLFGGDGDDWLAGNNGDDRLAGGSGDDNLHGQAGDDVMFGQAGRDRLQGHAGRDVLDGGSDDDIVAGSFGDDVLTGGPGRDILLGNPGDDVLSGGAGGDQLLGHDGDDVLDGGPHDDQLDGGDGTDNLTGDSGSDRLHGGSGADVCDGTPDDARDIADSTCEVILNVP
jgi:Ca2+-binding RTX toxin-like protein